MTPRLALSSSTLEWDRVDEQSRDKTVRDVVYIYIYITRCHLASYEHWRDATSYGTVPTSHYNTCYVIRCWKIGCRIILFTLLIKLDFYCRNFNQVTNAMFKKYMRLWKHMWNIIDIHFHGHIFDSKRWSYTNSFSFKVHLWKYIATNIHSAF